jgi:hypothetical protein
VTAPQPRSLSRTLELVCDLGASADSRGSTVPGALVCLSVVGQRTREGKVRRLTFAQRRSLVDSGADERMSKLEIRAEHERQPCRLE